MPDIQANGITAVSAADHVGKAAPRAVRAGEARLGSAGTRFQSRIFVTLLRRAAPWLGQPRRLSPHEQWQTNSLPGQRIAHGFIRRLLPVVVIPQQRPPIAL